MWASRRRQARGAALVEAAIVMLTFLLLVIGTMELLLIYYAWNRTSEAARDGLRWAVVNDPVPGAGILPACPSAVVTTVDCGTAGSCDILLARIQANYPVIQPGNVSVRYACSSVGHPDLPPALKAYEVAVTIAGVPDPMLAFLDVTLPGTTVAHTGEDLHTPAP